MLGRAPVEKKALDLDYQTPERVLSPVRAYFRGPIPLDPATTRENPTEALDWCFPGGADGLTTPWRAVGDVFVNPPYGKSLALWIEKIGLEAACGCEVLALIPCSRFEQEYMHRLIFGRANAVCFVRKRVAFLRPSTGLVAKGNPYSSMLVGFNVDLVRFGECFRDLGCCLHVALIGGAA